VTNERADSKLNNALTEAVPESVPASSSDLIARIKELELRLSKPLSPLKKTIADIAYPQLEKAARKVDEDQSKLAGDIFPRYFPPTLGEMLNLLLKDPDGYLERIEEYERICPSPDLDFSTETREFTASVKDPMRKMEEARVEKALMHLLVDRSRKNGEKLTALDLGSGNGRIARLVEKRFTDTAEMGGYKYTVWGIDILPSNVYGAKELGKKIGSKVDFLEGDISRLDFGTNTLSFVSSVATLYLIGKHRRPLVIAEIARVLEENGGVSCIVNPNEQFTCRDYGYIMLRTAFDRYFNPLNISVMRRLGSRVFYIEELGKKRPDMGFPDRAEMTSAIGDVLGAELLDLYSFPNGIGPNLMTAHSFRITTKTKDVLRKYTDCRESQGIKRSDRDSCTQR
jgi:ubiquinone/menaquinone biosynthesis C-methylase UbiE